MFAHFVPMPIGHRGVSFRYPDGVVEEVLPNDTAEAPKNSLRIRYADGERRAAEMGKTRRAQQHRAAHVELEANGIVMANNG